MKQKLLWVSLILYISLTGAQMVVCGNVDLPDYPSLSPDGSTIVFSWRGDLWMASSQGGHAERLTSHPAEETRSAWSPDGKTIAFQSNRDGAFKIYLMNTDGTDIRLLTGIDISCTLYGFGAGPNGDPGVTFTASMEGDVYRSGRPYWVSLHGGELIRIHDAFGSDPHISPDGKTCLITRGGIGWTRRFYYGPDQNDVWLYSREDHSFDRLTEWKGKDGKARWAKHSVYFLSDREDERVNLYRLDMKEESNSRRITNFIERDIKEFDVSANGEVAIMAVWDKIYRLDLGRSMPVTSILQFDANEDELDNVVVKNVNREVREARLSPDGKVMAYIAYGEVFVRNTEEKSPSQRVTHSHARERNIAWSPDGLKLYFVSDRSGSESIYCATVALTRGDVKENFESITNPKPEEEEDEMDEDSKSSEDEDDSEEEGKEDEDDGDDDKGKKKDKKKDVPKELHPERWHDAIQFNISPVIDENTNDRSPSPSPDGKWLAFKRTRGDLMLLNLDTGETNSLVEGWDWGMDWNWSPDSRYIAYHQNDMNFNSDIWIVPVDGSAKPVNITKHPNNDYNPSWSADGKILSFVSERINDESDVWLVFLDSDMESYTEKELQEYFKEANEKAKKRKPLSIDVPEDSDNDAENNEKPDDDKEKAPKKLDLDDAYLRLRRVTTLSG